MDFDWEDGNVGHLNERHNITTEQALEAFYSQLFVVSFQDRAGEFRRFALGETSTGQVLVLIYLLRQQRSGLLRRFRPTSDFAGFTRKGRICMAKKQMPTFASEAEEASWYVEHQDELENYMEAATAQDQARFRKELANLPSKEKALAEARAAQAAYEAKRPKTKQVPIRIAETDLERAKLMATKKGIGYQTLIKMALHEWLDQQERGATG